MTNFTTSQKGNDVSRVSSKCLPLKTLSRIPFLTLCDLAHTREKALLERVFWGHSASKAEDGRGDALEYTSVLSSCRSTEVGIIYRHAVNTPAPPRTGRLPSLTPFQRYSKTARNTFLLISLNKILLTGASRQLVPNMTSL